MSVPIPPAGIHRLSDEQYFALDLPSNSTTKTLLFGPNARLAHERENPREETDDFAIGAYVHALCLDPASVATNFVVNPKVDRRTKDGKAEWERVSRQAALSGARLITDEQVAKATAIAESVLAHPSASRLLASRSGAETTVIGSIGGRPAKCKIDAYTILETPAPSHGHILIDLKTTKSAEPRAFAKDAATFGYYHQFAFYRRLLEQQPSMGAQMDAVIIAVEKEPPYLCAVYRVPSLAIEIADRKIDGLVERWWRVKEGDRTGYPQDIVELEPPRWWLIGEE